MPVEDIRVESWDELTERLFEASWQASLGRFRSHFAFRGMRDAAEDLRTGLMRLGGSDPGQERHLLRNFRKYALRNTVREAFPDDLVWNWLARYYAPGRTSD